MRASALLSDHGATAARCRLLSCLLLIAVGALGLGCSSGADPAPGMPGVGGASGSGTTGSASGAGGNQCAAGLSGCPEGCLDLASNPGHCGGCGVACAAGQICQGSSCQCSGGLTACSNGCVEAQADAANCGGCGMACSAGLVCSLGGCSEGCADGLTQCGQNCVDVMVSPLNCGGCGMACQSGQVCSAGSCACPVAGQTPCGAECADTNASTAHCGSCGNQCAAGQTCEAGVCSGGTSTTSTTGAGGSGGSGSGVPDGLTGVVVAVDDSGTLGCVPLCQETEHPDDPDTSDDWAYEGHSCVLPNSPTGTRNQVCTTGEALPEIDRTGLAGVVVDAGDGLTCVPYCSEGAQPSSPDPENPSSYDWGWEYQASCIIIDSDTGVCNQRCTTGGALPDAALVSRPGVVIDELCVALCECDSAGDDPDWGWEYQINCVMPEAAAAQGVPACTTNQDQDLTPPPLTGSTVADGFYTEGGRLYDAYGNEFVMRGVNNPHIWFDTYNQYIAYQALDRIASYNTNTIRVVWETTGTASLLARILYRIVELHMVPMVELHDATGSQSSADLQALAAYYVREDVAAVLQDFRAYTLINIANEWSGTSDFQSAYATAIDTLRSAGLSHTLVIDGNAFGQGADAVLNNAATLLAGDPEGNLLFSVHMYSQYPSAAQVNAVLDQAVNNSVPLVIGEFGHQLQGSNVAWDAILSGCQERGIGYIAWSWSGNDSSTQQLNIVNDFGGTLTPQWGEPVMVSHAASIQNTAQPASIFQ